MKREIFLKKIQTLCRNILLVVIRYIYQMIKCSEYYERLKDMREENRDGTFEMYRMWT